MDVRFVIPKLLRPIILRTLHYGHPSPERCFQRWQMDVTETPQRSGRKCADLSRVQNNEQEH